MINEAMFLEMCKKANLQAYKVQAVLDDTDIVLDTDDIAVFFEVCKTYDARCVFYSSILHEKDIFEIDKDVLSNVISGVIDEKRSAVSPFLAESPFGSMPIDYDALERKYLGRIENILQEQRRILRKHKWGDTLFFDAFISACGDRIGISLFNNSIKLDPQIKSQERIAEELKDELLSEIKQLKSESYGKWEETARKSAQESLERAKKALDDIRAMLKESERLPKCTNGNLRREYARELSTEYSEKYDSGLSIGEVLAVVDEEYKILKRSNQ